MIYNSQDTEATCVAGAQRCICDGHHLTQPVQAGWVSQAASLGGRPGRHDGDPLRETGG